MDWGNFAGQAAGQAVGAGMGLLLGGLVDKRQLEQQRKLQEQQIKGAKEMADYQQGLQLDTWQKTNYKAQKEQLEKAGLNAGLLYGGGGGGGGTVASAGMGMPTGAVAADKSASVAEMAQMGLIMAQTEVMKSQARKNNVEADKAEGVDTEATKQNIANAKLAGTRQEFENEVNKAIGINDVAERYHRENSMLYYKQQKEMGEYNAWAAASFEGKATDDQNSPLAKAQSAGLAQTLVELKKASADLNIKQAEVTIKNFEAGLAKEGIPPNSPWGVKIIGDLLDKVGLLDLFDTGKKMVKDTIKH